MIKSFKHKELKQLFEKGVISGIPAQDAVRINDRLQAIDTASMIRRFKYSCLQVTPLERGSG